MNQLNQSGSSKRKFLWALLAVLILSFAGVGILIATQGKKLAVKMFSATFATITPLNLTAHYDQSASWNGASAWEVVPHDRHVLGGVPFDVNGLLRVTGTGVDRNSAKPYREKVEGIPVGQKFARLHLLHLVGYAGEDGTPYARVVLHYADGSTDSFKLLYGHHARNWHRSKFEYPSALADPNSKVVWRGTHESTDRTGKTLRLFKTTFENPKPDQPVVTMDVVSENAQPNAVILAMSIGPANLPAPKDNPASLPEPEEPYEGELNFTAVDAENGKPVPNVKLKVSGSDRDGSFKLPELVTGADGTVVVKHPGDTATSLSIATYGDGIPEKTIRWQPRSKDPIPFDYTYRVTKAATIGGVVRDDSGQPVSGATLALSQFGTATEPATARERVSLGLTTVKTEADGRWEFRSLPENSRQFALLVSHPEFSEVRYLSDGIERNYVGERVALASLLQTNALLKMRRGLAVSGGVVTESGEPVSGAKVLLGDSRFMSKPNQTKTDGRGEFRLLGANAGTTYLTVQASGYSPEMKQVTVDTNLPRVEFKLAPGRAFKARVADEFGTPVRTARLTIDQWQNRQTIDLNGTTDSKGRVTINSAPPDSMSGSIYKSGYMNLSGIQFVSDGEEHTFTLRRSATITGNVVDSETKQPVERFDVTRGQNTGGDRIYWQDYNLIKGTNGEFSFKRDQQSVNAIKIESDEHLATIVALGTNDLTHFDIELKKGSGPKGFVHGPDGQPVAGAQLAVLAPGGSLTMGAGKFENHSRSERRIAQTDARGAFALRAYTDGEKIIAVHPSGFAETGFSNFVSGSTIKLQTWGVIEGVLHVGNQPGTNQSLLLTPGFVVGASSFWYNFQDYKATTDAEGKFVISNAPPGERRLVRLIQTDQNSWSHSQPREVVVKPGEVTRVTIGGDGHLIIGQLMMSDPSLTINWQNSGHHSLNFFPRQPSFRSTEEYRAWEKSPEAAEARKQARSYTVQMTDTGAFHIEDVVPGNYSLSFHLREPNTGRGGMGQFIGSFNTNIVVPEFIKGPNVPPIDLGKLEIKVRPEFQGRPAATPPVKAAAANRTE